MSKDQQHHPPPPPQLPPHTSTAGTSAAAISAAVCGHCCSGDHWIFHYVKFKQLYRKLCTSCVLKLHLTSFCPTCFSLHDPTSINNNPIASSTAAISNSSSSKTLTCFKCSSLSHSTCVPPNAPKSPYLCPICTANSNSKPPFKFFDVRKPNSKVLESDQKAAGQTQTQQFLDERAAKVLLAAARIAAISMSKAASGANEQADKKVREAALAKKRAKEAIDYVMALSGKFGGGGGNGGGSNKLQRREEVSVAAAAAAVVPASTGLKSAGAGAVMVPVRLEKNGGGIGGRVSGVAAATAGVNTLEIKNVERPIANANANANNNGGPVAMAVAVKSAPPQHMPKNNNGKDGGTGQ